MVANNSVLQMIDELTDGISNETNADTSSIASIEEYLDNHVYNDQNIQNNSNEEVDNVQDNNEHDQVVDNIVQIVNNQPANEPIQLKTSQINIDIDFVWKMQAFINYKHPKRTYTNGNGTGEVSTWDLVDDTGSINFVAFNRNSHMMCNKLAEGKSFEFNRLSIRTVDDNYKTLPHMFQLLVTNTIDAREIILPFNYQLTYDFTHLNEVEKLPLNSIIDINVLIIRDYGITVGATNDNSWSRRELHVVQDAVHMRLTLWNDKAKIVKTSMVNMRIKLKNVKVSWFNDSHTHVTLGNTRLSIV